jgi:transcriptional antiterminator RfaH
MLRGCISAIAEHCTIDAWYAVHTKARQERVANEHLSRQHYEAYMPLVRLPKRRRGRWCEVIEPLFPGYLFVRLDIQRRNTSPIRSTRGVIGLVSFGNDPRPVPDVLVESLKAAQPDRQDAISQEHLFKSGDRVEIVSGPFSGLKAIFQASSGEDRVQLLLELLGRSNPIVLSRHQLVPASA